MIVANRTCERAQSLSGAVGAEVITLLEIEKGLADADIIIISTASLFLIIGKRDGRTGAKNTPLPAYLASR